MAQPNLKLSAPDQTGPVDALKLLARLLARDAVHTWLAVPAADLAAD